MVCPRCGQDALVRQPEVHRDGIYDFVVCQSCGFKDFFNSEKYPRARARMLKPIEVE